MKKLIFTALLFSLFFTISAADTVTTREGSKINVRKKAGSGSEKIGTVKGGEEFELIEEKNGWLHIQFDGGDGWIYGKLATINRDSDSDASENTPVPERDTEEKVTEENDLSDSSPVEQEETAESISADPLDFSELTSTDGSITFSGIPWGASMQDVQKRFGQAETQTTVLYDSAVAWVTGAEDFGTTQGTYLQYNGQKSSDYDTATFYFDSNALIAVKVTYQPALQYGSTLNDINAAMITALTKAFGKPAVTQEPAFSGKTVTFYRWTGEDRSTVQLKEEQYGMFLEVLYAAPRYAKEQTTSESDENE